MTDLLPQERLFINVSDVTPAFRFDVDRWVNWTKVFGPNIDVRTLESPFRVDVDTVSGMVRLFHERQRVPTHPVWAEALVFARYPAFFDLTLIAKPAMIRLRFTYSLNKILECLRSGAMIPLRDEICSHFWSSIPSFISGSEEVDKRLHYMTYPDVYPHLTVPEDAFFENTAGFDSIYGWQRQNVRFMINLEKRLFAGQVRLRYNQRYRPLVNLGHDYVYDPDMNMFSQTVSEQQKATTDVQFRGGCLFDETGMGKTVCPLLVAKSMGTKLANYDYGTMVLCPSQVCMHWKAEIARVDPSAKVLLVSTKRQYKDVSYADLAQYDYVIVTMQFIENPALKSQIDYFEARDRDPKKTFKRLRAELELTDELHVGSPLFHFGSWSRVIVDECHEMSTTYKSGFLQEIDCGVLWLLSGTPDMDSKTCLKWLIHPNSLQKAHVDTQRTFIMDFFFQTLVTRSTKESVRSTFEFKPICHEIVLLDMTPIETAIYKHISHLSEGDYDVPHSVVAEACCHPHVHFGSIDLRKCESPEEICHILTKDLVAKLKRLRGDVSVLQRDRSNTEQLLETMGLSLTAFPTPPHPLQTRLATLCLTVEDKQANMDRLDKSISYFQGALSFDDSKEETCPICLCDIRTLGVTKCGHRFCSECVSTWAIGYKSCPLCRQSLGKNGLFIVQKGGQENAATTREESRFAARVHQYGTKMASILKYVERNSKEKLVLFSQFDSILKKTGRILEALGIAYAVCTGSVNQRSNAITRFKTDEHCNIILLSSTHTSTGVNLECSNTVIFIDPIYTNSTQRRSLEAQAIARIHRLSQKRDVKIIKFIMKDTIEETCLE